MPRAWCTSATYFAGLKIDIWQLNMILIMTTCRCLNPFHWSSNFSLVLPLFLSVVDQRLTKFCYLSASMYFSDQGKNQSPHWLKMAMFGLHCFSKHSTGNVQPIMKWFQSIWCLQKHQQTQNRLRPCDTIHHLKMSLAKRQDVLFRNQCVKCEGKPYKKKLNGSSYHICGSRKYSWNYNTNGVTHWRYFILVLNHGIFKLMSRSWSTGWPLSHCGLVTPFGHTDLGQHWLR